MDSTEYKASTIAIVSDKPTSLPEMEEMAAQFREFGNLNAVPLCIDTPDADEIVETVLRISQGIGGICLESISAPKCFEIEKRLNENLDIPIFNNRGCGTAVVLCAAVIGAFKLLKKPLSDVRAAVSGAGVAGNAVTKMLVRIGIRDIVVCDSKGILDPKRLPEFGEDKLELLEMTNKDGLSGGIENAVMDRDLFIGVSKPEILTEELVQTMSKTPVVFAMARPEPEIMPEFAMDAGARVVGTWMRGYPNRIDSALAFPGLFRGAFDAGATDITEKMQIAAVYALAGLVSDKELKKDYILPGADAKPGVCDAVAKAASDAWSED